MGAMLLAIWVEEENVWSQCLKSCEDEESSTVSNTLTCIEVTQRAC